MLDSQEIAVKASFPSGYGGHVPNVRHDVFFENTGLFSKLEADGVNNQRDCFPAFKQQKSGAPTYKNAVDDVVPSFGSLPDVSVQPPWAITPPIRSIPSFKMTPNMAPQKNGK